MVQRVLVSSLGSSYTNTNAIHEGTILMIELLPPKSHFQIVSYCDLLWLVFQHMNFSEDITFTELQQIEGAGNGFPNHELV